VGPQDMCNLLVDNANKKGGEDNISVIIIQNK
jgi:serine/threonine protein phosphatase PrpC